MTQPSITVLSMGNFVEKQTIVSIVYLVSKMLDMLKYGLITSFTIIALIFLFSRCYAICCFLLYFAFRVECRYKLQAQILLSSKRIRKGKNRVCSLLHYLPSFILVSFDCFWITLQR